MFASYLIIFYFLEVYFIVFFFFFQAEDGIRDRTVTGVQTCALPISSPGTVCVRPSHRRHLVHWATSAATAATERACEIGSLLKRSPAGGSKESPGGGGS